MDESESLGTMNHDQLVVYELREALKGKWPHPEVFASWAFTVTELSEVGDILLRMGYVGTFVRNHEKAATRVRLAIELGQTLMMLCTLANHLGINLSDALLKASRRQARKHGEEIFVGPVRQFQIIDDEVKSTYTDEPEQMFRWGSLKYRTLRQRVEYTLMRMGFNMADVQERIPIQAFWTALEAAIRDDGSSGV